MKVEGKWQKKIRQNYSELRKNLFWRDSMRVLVEECREALESAKTKKDTKDVIKQYFGYEQT